MPTAFKEHQPSIPGLPAGTLRHEEIESPDRAVEYRFLDRQFQFGGKGQRLLMLMLMLLASICRDTVSDEERIRRGSVLFEDLYRHFQKNK